LTNIEQQNNISSSSNKQNLSHYQIYELISKVKTLKPQPNPKLKLAFIFFYLMLVFLPDPEKDSVAFPGRDYN
jgi:hypothetical protein